MAKKELSDKELLREEEGSGKSRRSGKGTAMSGKFVGVVEFLLGIFLLPCAYAASVAFLNEIGVIDAPLQNYFWWGVLSFILIYLFVWEPEIVYSKGHEVLEDSTTFLNSLVKFAPQVLPVYTILVFVIYGIIALFTKSDEYIGFCVFLAGLTMALHLVFSAKALRSKKGDFLKGNYIFGFSFIYIFNLFLLSFLLSLAVKGFSFVAFSGKSYQAASKIFYAVFKQLFMQ